MHPAGRRSAGTRAGLQAGSARAQGKGAAPSDPRRRRQRRRQRRRLFRSAGRRRRAAGARAGSYAAFWRSIYNAAAPVQSRRPGSRRVLASTALAAEGHHVISRVGADAASAPARWHTWVLRGGRAGEARAARGATERPSPARCLGKSERVCGRGPGPERALRGAPGWAPPARPLRPRAAAAQRGPVSARTWGRATGARSPRPPPPPPPPRPPGAVTEASPSPSPSPLSERGAWPGSWGGGAPASPGRRPWEPAPGAARAAGAGTRSERGLMSTSAAAQRVPAQRSTPHSNTRSPPPARGCGTHGTHPGSAPALLGPRMRPTISVQVQGGLSARAPGPCEPYPLKLRAGGEGEGASGRTGSPRPAPSTLRTQPPASQNPLPRVDPVLRR